MSDGPYGVFGSGFDADRILTGYRTETTTDLEVLIDQNGNVLLGL